MGSRKWMPYIL